MADDDVSCRASFEREGRLWIRGALRGFELDRLRTLASSKRPGMRTQSGTPLFEAIAAAAFSRRIAAIWKGMRPVRVVEFEKCTGRNWGVPWHQDRVIAVDRRVNGAGCSNWTRKRGAWHCEPPSHVLSGMLFVRVHLDPSTSENGAMEIAPGSHRLGPLPAAEAAGIAEAEPNELTLADAGDVLILPMLVLHRSLPARQATGRRVLRVDYAAGGPPSPLRWAISEGGPSAEAEALPADER